MSYDPAVGRHAPNDLRDAFLSLADIYYRARGQEVEPSLLNYEPIVPEVLCSRLRNCTDIMPSMEAEIIDLKPGATYAEGVKRTQSCWLTHEHHDPVRRPTVGRTHRRHGAHRLRASLRPAQ